MHTPGPWTACPRNARTSYRIETKGTGNDLSPIADVDGPDAAPNARLIAQSPNLLDLLTESLMYVEECEEFHDKASRTLSKRIRAAIEAINPTK